MKFKSTTLFLLFLASILYSHKITDFRLLPSFGADMDFRLGFYADEQHIYDYKQQSLSGVASLDLCGHLESEPRVISGKLHFFYLPTMANLYRDDTAYQDVIKYRQSSLYLKENLSGDFYINNSNLFWTVSGDGDIGWHYENQDSCYSHTVNGYYDAMGGLGIGRLRDGTPFYKTIEIINILTKEKIITRRLDKDEILGLAQILNQKWYFQLRYDRYIKFYYKEIEDYLKSIGIYKIPAYVWFRIKEVIDEEIEPREFGLKLLTGFGLTGTGFAAYEVNGSDTTAQLEGNPTGQIKVLFQSAYPLTYRLQFRNSFRFIIYEIDNETELAYYSSFSFAYLVFQKVEAILDYDWERYCVDEFSKKRLKNHSLTLTLKYYLEDKISVDWINSFCYRKEDNDRPYKLIRTNIGIKYDAL